MEKQYSEKSSNEIEQLVRSGNHLPYFQSHMVDIYKCIGKIKMDMSNLGQNLDVKLTSNQEVGIKSFLSTGCSLSGHSLFQSFTL